jgi:hypothetical protein
MSPLSRFSFEMLVTEHYFSQTYKIKGVEKPAQIDLRAAPLLKRFEGRFYLIEPRPLPPTLGGD